ncbi:hypothetical protein BRC66_05950 [Halobacteriales archaeon QH_2_66_30]|nr:MAG: hypothetical protein BRC66_05950 [Halobacteriales archaeon QH_2_66_30]
MQRRTLYGGSLGAAGLLLAGIQLLQGIQQVEGFDGGDRAIVYAFETVPFVLIGLALAFVGYWLTTQPAYEPDLPRIVAWGVGSTLLFASVAALILFSQQVTTNSLKGGEYVAMNQITVGAVVGVLVGLYDARSRQGQRELAAERDRVEQFAQKAADVNNYGRELNRSDSLDEVSSLCIQGIQAFLDVTGVAIVATDADDHEFLDNTVVSAADETLFELANDALDQEPASAVTVEDPPDALDAPTDLLSMLVTTHDDSSIVLLAFVDESNALEIEDVQLLEMLVAHAATAVDRIYDRRLAPAEGEPRRSRE